MQSEREVKASEILRKIKTLERAIELIESGETIEAETAEPYKPRPRFLCNDTGFEDWEIRLIIDRKKRKIRDLKKELEVI